MLLGICSRGISTPGIMGLLLALKNLCPAEFGRGQILLLLARFPRVVDVLLERDGRVVQFAGLGFDVCALHGDGPRVWGACVVRRWVALLVHGVFETCVVSRAALEGW